jgi:hypothetical protein
MANNLHDPKLDPRLFAPPRNQPYTAVPQHNASQPYYLSTPTHQQPPHLSQTTPLGAALDPALEQTSPTGPEASQDEDEHEDDGDQDGYVMSYLARKNKHPSSYIAHWDHNGKLTRVNSMHATPGSAKSPGDMKRPRACDSCRGLKVRL